MRKNTTTISIRKIILLLCIISLVAICASACGNNASDDTNVETESTKQETTKVETESTKQETSKKAEQAKNDKSAEGIRPEFKKAMDSYEDFFDEYCKIMKKYNKNPNDTTILADYTEYMGEYADMMNKMNAWEDKDLSNEELAYYTKVTSRITGKLAKVSAEMQ